MSIRGRLRSSHSSEEQYRLGECRKCGQHSANQSLITCSLCEIQYHPKCLSLSAKLVDLKHAVDQWSCRRCRNCVFCGKKHLKSTTGARRQTMIACSLCDTSAHPFCIAKYAKSRTGRSSSVTTSGTNKKYVCHKCCRNVDDDSASAVSAGSLNDDSSVGHNTTSADEDDDNDSEDEDDVSDGEEQNEEVVEEEEEDSSSDEEVSRAEDVDVDDEDNDSDNKRTRSRQRTGRSGAQRLTRSMTKLSTDSPKSSTSAVVDHNNIGRSGTKANAEEESQSDDENIEANADTGTGRTALNGKRKRKKRGRGAASYMARMRTKSLKTGTESDADCKAELTSDKEDINDGKCSVPECDSTGHLSGKFNTHSTMNTCPVYHNITADDCRHRYAKRAQRRQERQQLDANRRELRTKTTNSPNKEDKCSALIESRRRDMLNDIVLDKSCNDLKIKHRQKTSSREPDLKSLTPIFDLEMFREAQARAAELIEEQLAAEEQPNGRTGIRVVEMGRYEMSVWYSSPYPEEYQCLPKLYICEFCLKYTNSPLILKRHLHKCVRRHPPGDEIYRKANISFFEIDGETNKQFCQNLCLLAKLFLDHKTLYFDVEPFLFYIMTESDAEGCHIIGYFSKEKQSFLSYNVSCILTLPPYQRQGYGKMLIDFSYLLTKAEGKVGSPEKPLSDLGLISYRSYWKQVILEYLCSYQGTDISIRDVSQQTGINAYDIVSTLQSMGMLKYWKGKHLVLTQKDVLDEFRSKLKKRKNPKLIDPKGLHWTPKYK